MADKVTKKDKATKKNNKAQSIQVDVLDWNKKKVDSVKLPVDIFGARVNKPVMHSVVKWQLAKRRRGCHKTKDRSEVSGGGKKPFRQKGTGNARQGSIRSPLMEGGGVTFGPTPRDYSYTLPKKIKRLGLVSALSHLLESDRLHVVNEIKIDKPKTKEVALKLKNMGSEKAVLIDKDVDHTFKRASKNIRNIRYYSVDGLNVYDLLKYNRVIVSKNAVDSIIKRCS